MKPAVYRFAFDRKTPLLEAEMSLHLAMVAIEGLLGQSSVRMDAAYHIDAPRHVIIVDGTTEVGAALVRVFTTFLIREFGDNAFNVRRVEPAITGNGGGLGAPHTLPATKANPESVTTPDSKANAEDL